MFTGIIEEVGCIVRVQEVGSGRMLHIAASFSDSLVAGQSIAVNGACLTVERANRTTFVAFIVPETLRKTTLHLLCPDAPVNLERAMVATARFEGHIVQGHIDATCYVLELLEEGHDRRYTFNVPPELRSYLVPRGSITLDGISLTIARLAAESFTVAIIPHTQAHTMVHRWQVGTQVNVECDVVGKYVAHHLAALRQ